MQQYLIFNLEQQFYAVEINKVKEVAKTHQITTLPHLPKEIKGITILRGRTIPIIDIALKWKKRHRDSLVIKEYVIVLDIDGEEVGWLVDEIIDIVRWETKDLKRIDWGEDLKEQALVQTAFIQEGQFIGILSEKAFQ
ncbi:MAG: chemotaxis protein CheW [Cellulosilyticum sp.]|nr:chemotaxis protein CheW [Cellulosilyticum sp.]